MDMSKYRDLFISEAREHIQGMNDCVLVLEKTPDSIESVNELFRHAHSVKGMSASMGYGEISELSHRLEDMMDTVRKGQTPISQVLIDLLLQGLDFLEGMVEAVEHETALDTFDTADFLGQVRAVAEGRPPAAAAGGKPEPEAAGLEGPEPEPDLPEIEIPEAAPGPDAEAGARRMELPAAMPGQLNVHFRIAEDSLVPCARAYLTMRKLELLGKIVESRPSLDEVKAGRCTGEVALVLAGAAKKAVGETLGQMAEMGQFSVDGPAEVSAPRPAAKPAPAPVPAAAPPDAVPAPAPVVESRSSAGAAPKTVRISTALLDTFINLVGELIVTKSRLNDLLKTSGSRVVDQVLTRVDHLVGGLHTEVMKVRMTPLETVTQRLPRVVRDLSRKSGKKISLTVEGAEIELDRAILEELGDPLIHILRNSVDHGIEDEAARRKAGKAETGRITLRAFRERDMVHVEVSDDGRGMDLERIKAKAIEKGIITTEQARVMSEEETVMLVCRPGFSTAERVTEVSGRGVGMDVVQSVVESLGGTLMITSRTGQGTTFTLKLPLTVAIVKMLLVRLREHLFAIPITRVVRTVRVQRDQVKQSRGRQYLALGEELVTLYELRDLLAMPATKEKSGLLTVVLVEVTNRTAGIVVDRVAGQVDIVVKPLCYPLQYLPRYSGMTVLGDGRIVPILDLGHLF